MGEDQEENVNIDVFSLDRPSWYVLAATETNDPEMWLAYAQDRKEEDPRYSVPAFRRDILLSCTGQGSLDAEKPPSPSESTVQPPILEHLTCPWIRLLCVRSGKPTPVQDCCDCEFRNIKKCETKPILLEE